MKKMIISWLIIAVCLFGTIYFIGIRVNQEYKPYRDYEADLVESATVYLELTDTKLKKGEKKIIKIEEMLKNEVLSTKNVNGDECDGYVDVKNTDGKYQYNAYIKCKDYTTVDYKE